MGRLRRGVREKDLEFVYPDYPSDTDQVGEGAGEFDGVDELRRRSDG